MNNKKITLELTRIQLCDLLIACTCADRNSPVGTKKWIKLHTELKKILNDFDKEQEENTNI